MTLSTISIRAALILTLWSSANFGCACAESSGTLYLKGATIEDGTGAQPYRATIVVRNGRVDSISKLPNIPGHANVIDLTGRYLVPGFTDMHAHVTFLRNSLYSKDPGYDEATSKRILRMLLAYGITTVRNPAAPPENGVALREAVKTGKVLGPRIFTAGLPFNGQYRTEADIRHEVKREARVGVDYIKVYAGSTPKQTAIAIDEAHRCRLKVIGHLQDTDVPTASAEGIDFITHGVSWSTSALPKSKRAEYEKLMKGEHGIRSRIFWLENVDESGPEMDEIIRALVGHNISLDPTLIAYATKFVPQERYQGGQNVSLAPTAMQADWRDSRLTSDWSLQDFARMKSAWPKMLRIVRRYYDDGVQLTTGSDLPNPFVVPGVSLHQEMELLSEAGIPADAILAMTTRNAAASLGIQNDAGTIAVGKRADTVVLDSDPLKDIHNTRTIRYVLLGGLVLEPAKLLATVDPEWTTPLAPFQIADNLYYVGSRDLASYLVTTPAGHILINANLETSPRQIRASVQKLGFHWADIKILLNGQAHFDHMAGAAEVIEETHAQDMVMDGDSEVVRSGGRKDFAFGTEGIETYAPARVDRVLHDGDTVTLGGITLTANKTAGHTRGCTTWTFRAHMHGDPADKMRDVVIVGGIWPLSQYWLVDTPRHKASYPGIRDDFNRTFEKLRALPCDIFLGSHGAYFDLLSKLRRMPAEGEAVFIDPKGYIETVDDAQAAFDATVAAQSARKP